MRALEKRIRKIEEARRHHALRVLRAEEHLPPWQHSGLTAEQATELVVQAAQSPPGSQWRLEALLQWLEAAENVDDPVAVVKLKWAIEDEHKVLGRECNPMYHVCHPSRCKCIPPRRRQPFVPRLGAH